MLERSQTRGHSLGTIAPSPVQALNNSRAMSSAHLSLLDVHRILDFAHPHKVLSAL